MREALMNLATMKGLPDHLALAYNAWAPVSTTGEQAGKVPNDQRADWLKKLAGLKVSPDYRHAFNLWKNGFTSPNDRTVEVMLAARLLVGHGNPSGSEVGITVHHTWGVPIIPGSALKGLLAHYVDAVYGPDNPDTPQWEQTEEEQKIRAKYKGVTWNGWRIQHGPGDVYRDLFGAPAAIDDEKRAEHNLPAGAARGNVFFHDALYVPGSASDDQPFAVDVLTVHQREYYKSEGKSWPNDYDSPNPVGFISVRPKTKFLLALSGPADWTKLAQQLLLDALAKWGVGGKTSSGYGRLARDERAEAKAREFEAAQRREAMERQRRAALTPLGRELEEIARPGAGNEPPYMKWLQALEVGRWKATPESEVVVARAIKREMEQQKKWKPTSNKANPKDDKDHQRTLRTMKYLPKEEAPSAE